jgi:hypothetical protein
VLPPGSLISVARGQVDPVNGGTSENVCYGDWDPEQVRPRLITGAVAVDSPRCSFTPSLQERQVTEGDWFSPLA